MHIRSDLWNRLTMRANRVEEAADHRDIRDRSKHLQTTATQAAEGGVQNCHITSAILDADSALGHTRGAPQVDARGVHGSDSVVHSVVADL